MFERTMKGLSFFLAVVLVLSAVLMSNSPSVYADDPPPEFAGGNGLSAGTAYEIEEAYQLNNVRNHLDAYFRLTADIDLTAYLAVGGPEYNNGEGWVPIGTDFSTKFKGKFDGSGHTITSMKINRTSGNYQALFGYIASGSEIKNVGLVDIDVTGGYYVGGLVGASGGSITNSYTTGEVTGEQYVGGLVGYSDGGTISNTYSTGEVTSDQYVGGLVGYSSGSITNSYATGEVTSINFIVGGLVGYLMGSITTCYAIGEVTGDLYVGGLVGYSSNGSITNSYATGKVTGNNAAGGLVGGSIDGSIIYSYYDMETTTLQSDTGNGEGKSTTNMKDPNTYTEWFSTPPNWGIDLQINNGYPYFLRVVTYDGNGNDIPGGSVPGSSNTYMGASVIVSDNTGDLTKSGYAFVGWNTQEDGLGARYNTGKTLRITGDVTLYAQWTPINTVSFDKNDGDTEANPTTKTVIHGGHVDALPMAPTRVGYSFAGWNALEDGSGTSFDDMTAVTENLTVYAQWTINSYMVSFDKNSGDAEANPTTKTVTHGGHVDALPTVPSKVGYVFAGWNTEGNGSGTSFDDATAVTENLTVYAQWTINSYTVSFDKNSGDAEANPTTKTVTHGGHVDALPTAPSKVGYVFAGWNTEGNGSGTSFDDATAVTENLTVYAKWVANQPDVPIIQSTVSDDSNVTISWTSVPAATGYNIYQSINSGSYGNPLATVSGTVYSYQASGLTNGTRYYFVVKAVNAGGESAASNEVSATPKTVPAAPTNVTAVAGNAQATVAFTTPTDNGGSAITEYEVTASPGNITRTGITSPIIITGLNNGTSYTFIVRAINGAGSSALSAVSNTVVPSSPYSGGSGGTYTPSQPVSSIKPETTNTDVDVLVNGKAEIAGTVSTSKRNDQTVTTIAVDPKVLEDKLAAKGQHAVITIPVNGKSDVIVGELDGQMIKNMEDKQAVLEIQSDRATYTLPAQQINISAISDQFGKTVALQDIKVQIEIAVLTADMVEVVENAAKKGSFTLVVPPLSFTVRATYEGKTIELSTFNAYVERTIAIPEGVDPNKITTGVVVDPDGTVRHVPTKMVVIDGKYYAIINSLTNSTYSVVWHPLEFRDVTNHWAKNAVNDMGSRMVINGTENGMFSPDRDITRAEFAAIIVRGLGLKPDKNGVIAFSDVKASDWYGSAIYTAYAFHLISGFEDGTFRPNDKITREQAMAIISKAMTITNVNDKLSVQSIDATLRPYADAAEVSAWAQSSIADSLQAGIVSGRSNTELAPKAYMTRAEVAAIVQRLLQKSGLI